MWKWRHYNLEWRGAGLTVRLTRIQTAMPLQNRQAAGNSGTSGNDSSDQNTTNSKNSQQSTDKNTDSSGSNTDADSSGSNTDADSNNLRHRIRPTKINIKTQQNKHPLPTISKRRQRVFKSAPCVTGCKMDLENIRELGSRDFALIQSLKLWKGRRSNERKHEN